MHGTVHVHRCQLALDLNAGLDVVAGGLLTREQGVELLETSTVSGLKARVNLFGSPLETFGSDLLGVVQITVDELQAIDHAEQTEIGVISEDFEFGACGVPIGGKGVTERDAARSRALQARVFDDAQKLMSGVSLSVSFVHAAVSMARCEMAGSKCGYGEWVSRNSRDPRILFVVREDLHGVVLTTLRGDCEDGYRSYFCEDLTTPEAEAFVHVDAGGVVTVEDADAVHTVSTHDISFDLLPTLLRSPNLNKYLEEVFSGTAMAPGRAAELLEELRAESVCSNRKMTGVEEKLCEAVTKYPMARVRVSTDPDSL